jgi:hypothetical protein
MTDEMARALDRWQRGEIDGFEARRITGATSIGFLYKLAQRHDLPILFTAGDVVRRHRSRELDAAAARAILGMSAADWAAFEAAIGVD